MNKKNIGILIGLFVAIIAIIACIALFMNRSYKVIFDSNGGTPVLTEKVKKGEVVKEPNYPTKEGYIFDAWYLNDIKFDFNTKITSNITLEAKWVVNPVSEDKVTVIFNSTGGSSIANAIVKSGESITKPSDPTREGYIFKGWYLNGAKFDFDTKINGNITLEAKWEENSDDSTTKTYTVTFNSNGGSKVSSKEVNHNEKISKPKNPAREGYNFVGWYYNNTKYNFSTKVTKNMVLTAKWEKIEEAKTYTVTFDADGGSNVSSMIVLENKTVEKPNNPTKAGYTFKYWSLNNQKYDFDTKITKDITLKAVWEKENVTINVTSITLNHTSLTLTEGESATLIATVKPDNATNKTVTFKSSDTSIVTIDSKGNIKALKAGTVKITATSDGKSKELTVTVKEAVTYIAVWEDILTSTGDEASNVQKMLRIKDTKGNYYAGVITVTSKAGKTQDYDIPTEGKMMPYNLITKTVVKKVK